jgi:hypothetical protein
MEVHFTPDVQAKLEQMARDTGRRSDELVEAAVIGLFDELAYTREMLDRRYDDLESGRVQPIDGEEACWAARVVGLLRRRDNAVGRARLSLTKQLASRRLHVGR